MIYNLFGWWQICWFIVLFLLFYIGSANVAATDHKIYWMALTQKISQKDITKKINWKIMVTRPPDGWRPVFQWYPKTKMHWKISGLFKKSILIKAGHKLCGTLTLSANSLDHSPYHRFAHLLPLGILRMFCRETRWWN